jgi:hypothetical protein
MMGSGVWLVRGGNFSLERLDGSMTKSRPAGRRQLVKYVHGRKSLRSLRPLVIELEKLGR